MSTESRKRPAVAAARDAANDDDVVEWCDHCLCEAPHSVAIRILSESDEPEKARFSRQPYRETECRACGEASLTRLNDTAGRNCSS